MANGADLEAGPAPVQQADATDRHMEDFFKEVTAIKVCFGHCTCAFCLQSPAGNALLIPFDDVLL